MEMQPSGTTIRVSDTETTAGGAADQQDQGPAAVGVVDPYQITFCNCGAELIVQAGVGEVPKL
jgi:uncharacterized protein YaiE (UPF0345 family)